MAPVTNMMSRFDVESNLTGIIQNLTTLTGAPEALHLNRGTGEDSLAIIGRHPDVSDPESCLSLSDTIDLTFHQLVSPFNAPPFVTYKEMEDHITESGSGKELRSDSGRTGLSRLG